MRYSAPPRTSQGLFIEKRPIVRKVTNCYTAAVRKTRKQVLAAAIISYEVSEYYILSTVQTVVARGSTTDNCCCTIIARVPTPVRQKKKEKKERKPSESPILFLVLLDTYALALCRMCQTSPGRQNNPGYSRTTIKVSRERGVA